MAALVTTNVLSRWIGRAIVPDDIQLVQELMVLVILFPVGLVTALREHISVDLFTNWTKKRGRFGLAVIEHLVGVVFVGLLTWAAWRGVAETWASQDYYSGVLDIPMWLGHATFFAGVCLFLVRLLWMLVRDLRSLA